MPNAFSLFGIIKVDTKGFETALTKATTSLKKTETALTKAENAAVKSGANASRGIDRIRTSATSTSSAVSRLASTAGMLAGGAIATMAGLAIKSAISFDSLKMALTAVSGSAEKAQEQFVRLREVAKAPGLGFKEAIQGSVNLQAAGLAANTAERALMAFGNALGTVGKGKAELDGVITALSQIQSKGKVSAEEINQLAERLPQIRVAMQNAFGTADTEALQKMGLTSTAFIEKIITEFEKLPKVVGGAQNSIDNFKDTLEQALAPLGQKILDAVIPAMDKLAAELGKDNPDYIKAGENISQQIGDGVGKGLSKAIAGLPDFAKLIESQLRPPTEGFTPIYMVFGKSVINSLLKGLQSIDTDSYWKSLQSSWIFTLTTLVPRMFAIGAQIVQGLINGVRSLFGGLRETMGELGSIAETAARARLDTRSPSKVFFAIGKDVAQGFIDGIAAMKASTFRAMAGLFDISAIKGLGKKDAPGVELLTSLIGDLSKLNVVTKEQEVRMEMTAGKYEKLNKAIRERIILAAQEIDKTEALASSRERLNEIFDEFITKALPEKTNIEKLNAALAGPDVQLALGAMNERLRGIITSMMQINALNKDFQENPVDLGQGSGVGQGTGGPNGLSTGASPAPDEWIAAPRLSWENFWEMMKFRMNEFRQSLPSMKEAIGENLVSGIMELGNVFGTAINDWIANGENFFKAIAKGFRQMVANIIGELVRLMVFQLLMKIIGVGASAAGSGAAPGGGVNSSAGSWGGGWGFADGGMISGKGTSTSDSILARLSNGEFVMSAKAVKRWGADTLASMNSGMMPAFAGGGLVGGSSSVTTNAPVYNIHINGGGNQDTVRSVKQGIREATRMQQREEWRRK